MLRAALAAIALALPALPAPARAGTGDRVLVLTRTEGFRHDSIAPGLQMLRRLAPGRGLRIEATEDATRLTDRRLRGVRAVVFLQTTGDVLDPPAERALGRFVRRGGGWLGVHAAADSERTWPFYGATLLGGGAWQREHPPIQRATVIVEDRRHPAMRHLPRRWTRTDEWYSFLANPRDAVNVVARLDESSYDPGAVRMGDHPIAWWRRAGRGRAFYTALGHTSASYAEPAFRRHVLGALAWVARR